MGPCTNNSGGSRGEARKACLPPPPYFYTKLRPEGRKKIFFGDRTPLLSNGLDEGPPPLSQGLDPTLNKIHYSTQY